MTNPHHDPRLFPSLHSRASAGEPSAPWSELEGRIRDLVVASYQGGWQPAELLRQARREATKGGSQLAKLAVAADQQSRAPDAYHPLWQAHIDGLGLPAQGVEPGWLGRRLMNGLSADDAWSLYAAWAMLGPLPCLLPPPEGVGAVLDVDAIAGTTPNPVLDRVRALLAKAEGTTFVAEAEAFTAKAHELMARHMIDEAMLGAANRSVHRGSHPITIRLAVDAPYAAAKFRLVHAVADAGGCRAVLHQRLGIASVVGHASDTASVELLFTSLLVQAQTALHQQAATGSAYRTRGFRSSFIDAFASRVGERLRQVNEEVRRSVEAETGQSLVPLLADREEAVQDSFDRLFTNVVTRRSRRQWDPLGATSGVRAANRAQLDTDSIDRHRAAELR